jgi:hypothetical protein
MREIAAGSEHVLLGTATPIQTQPEDLWDLIGILHQGRGNFVLGNDFAAWHRADEVLEILSGRQEVSSAEHAWELLRSPLPLVDSTREPRARRLFSAIRQDLGLVNGETRTSKSLADLSDITREFLEDELDRRLSGATFFQRENPLVRHVVLRKRVSLEDAGLLARVGVDVHPDRQLVREPQGFDALFEAKALRSSEDFREAYREARILGKAPVGRGGGGGFMRNLVEQRIGRIKRFGQKRDTVDMLNLVNEQTVDEKTYERLSDRMRDRYDRFGSVPDTIKDEWIDDIEALGQKMDEYIHAQREATGFDLRYTATMAPPDKDWRDCTAVLSRRDFAVLMTTAWSG